MNQLKVCPENAIGTFSECLQSVFTGKLAPSCKSFDEMSPKTCLSSIQESSVIISMFGNGTAHYDRRQGDLVKKPEDIVSFAVVSRSRTQGTLFCQQSKHKHIAPDLKIPALTDKSTKSTAVIAIKDFKENLNEFLPVTASMDKMKLDLLKVNQLLFDTQQALRKSHETTHTTMNNLKEHFSKAITTVENKFDSFTLNFLLKTILPITLPPLCIAIVLFIFLAQIKKCFTKSKTARTIEGGELLNSQCDSRMEATELENTP